jgi:hypothetical protein
MHPRRIVKPARDKSGGKTSIFGWSRSCIPHNEAPIGGTCTKHSFLLQPCDVLLRASQIRPIPANSGFASHRAAFFFCFVAAQRSPTFFRNPNVTSHTTHHPHHTTQKIGNPPSGLPLFRQIQPTRPGGRLFPRRIQLAVSHNPFEPKSGRSRLAGLSWVFN